MKDMPVALLVTAILGELLGAVLAFGLGWNWWLIGLSAQMAGCATALLVVAFIAMRTTGTSTGPDPVIA